MTTLQQQSELVGDELYSVWDDDTRQLLATNVPWARVVEAISSLGVRRLPADLKQRVDADPTALIWAGFTIQRVT